MKEGLSKRENALIPDIAKKINIRLLQYNFYHIKTSLLISLFCATILFIGLYDADHRYLFAWYALTILVTICRSILTVEYQTRQSAIKDFNYWRRLFILGAIWGGISWSVLIIYLFPTVTNLQQTLCILIIAGITAGSVTTLSGIMSAVIGYLFFSLSPLIMELMLFHQYIYTLFSFTVMMYFIFLIAISFNIHKVIRNVIYLQFENDVLLQKLHHHATHDALTDMDNTRQFYANLSYTIDYSKCHGNSFTLIFIDLDYFKNVNDTYGHEMGDKILILVAERLKKITRHADFVARVGGDEFTVILWQLSDRENITKIAKNICEELRNPFEINRTTIQVSASVGISIYPSDAREGLELLKSADQAMYYAKKHGRNNYCFSSAIPVEEVESE